MRWLDALQRELSAGKACVRVTVSEVKGSTPRKVGARMVITQHDTFDTIGGGALEQKAVDQARTLLKNRSSEHVIQTNTLKLGVDASQCCGGEVTLLFEYHPAAALTVVVFGAGHVAQCVAKILAELPCIAEFHDSRADWLDKLPQPTESMAIIKPQQMKDNPFTVVEHCPDGAYFLVMTHSHELDYELVEAILARGDSRYCGLIASDSKAVKCRRRLARKGFSESEIARLTSPIGASIKTGHYPMQVALAAVSELMQRAHSLAGSNADHLSDKPVYLPD